MILKKKRFDPGDGWAVDGYVLEMHPEQAEELYNELKDKDKSGPMIDRHLLPQLERMFGNEQ
jgi:hypothetical protein